MSWYSLSVKPMEEYTSAVIAGICRSISAATVCALVLLGCGSGFKWDGEWEGNRKIKSNPGENPGIARTMGQVTVKIEGGRFKMGEAGLPSAGNIRTEGEKAFLTIDTFMDQPLDRQPKEVQEQMKEITLTAQKDGTVVFDDPGAMIQGPVTLTRKQPEP